MSSYYEALPIYRVSMDVAVRVDAVVQRLAKGYSRRVAYLLERPFAAEPEQEKPK